jgi:hypothetical protein
LRPIRRTIEIVIGKINLDKRGKKTKPMTKVKVKGRVLKRGLGSVALGLEVLI